MSEESSISRNKNIYTRDDVNPYRTMVMDAVGNDYERTTNRVNEIGSDYESPNPEAAKFYDLLRDANEPLWMGCKKYTKLFAIL